MQISAANMLLAGQQPAKPQPQTAASAFGHALGGAAKAEAARDGFESMLFKQATAPASAPAAAAATGPAQPYAAAKPPGSQLDIRV